MNANIAQIVQAQGEKPSAIPFLITIMSLASCLSRVLVGATAQLFEDARLPRTLFVLCSVTVSNDIAVSREWSACAFDGSDDADGLSMATRTITGDDLAEGMVAWGR